jgi:hypothetical protein
MGRTRRDGALRGAPVRVTFGGQAVKEVQPGEEFLSDEAELYLPEGHDLAFSWTLTNLSGAPAIPCAQESILAAYSKWGGGARPARLRTALPSTSTALRAAGLFLRRAPSRRVIAFLGDSITQGYGTGEGREMFWAAQVARRLPPGTTR